MQRQDSDENNLFFGIDTKRYQFTTIEEYIKFISIVGYEFKRSYSCFCIRREKYDHDKKGEVN